MTDLTYFLGQLNFTVGDIENNTQKILKACRENKANIFVFPELALSGYPPEDLLLRKDFLIKIKSALEHIKNNMPENICVIVGYPEQDGNFIYNSAAVLTKNNLLANHRKQLLPNYGVFDEERYFTHGNKATVFNYKNKKIGVTICEDLWFQGPAELSKQAGAEMLITINASPYYANKFEERLIKMRERIKETNLPLVYVNHYCGQDDLIFDGNSFILDSSGNIIHQEPGIKNIYDALQLGLKDYVHKNKFTKTLLGLSGGIDSSLTLAIAVDALGKDNVLPVLLPSRYTSQLSLDLAKKQLDNMELNYHEISIEPMYKSALETLNIQTDNLTTQNLQARIRAVILMAIANETNSLLLNTSNKSEIAVGYGTLYGDMCGAYAVIKDLWKTDVYKIASEIDVIPKEIITRPPTAELAPNQFDTDALPPYDILDEILKNYIEKEKSIDEIIKLGFDEKTVKRVINMVVKNEYKRKQSPLGPRVSPLAFTRERRYPITTTYL